MTRRATYLLAAGLLCGAATLGAQDFKPASSSGVTSPVATDPLSFTGVVTFDNAANTAATFSDGLTASSATVGGLTVGGVVCKGAPAVATTGTVQEVLATCTIPAGTLSVDGESIRVTIFGHTAANANNKQIFARVGGIGGTLVYSSAAAAANNQNFFFGVPLIITRLSATTYNARAQAWYNADASSAGATSWNYYSLRSGSATWANANDLVITATTASAAGDLTLDSYMVEVLK